MTETLISPTLLKLKPCNSCFVFYGNEGNIILNNLHLNRERPRESWYFDVVIVTSLILFGYQERLLKIGINNTEAVWKNKKMMCIK